MMEVNRIGARQLAMHYLFLLVCYRCLFGTMSSLHRYPDLYKNLFVRSSLLLPATTLN